MINTKIIVGNRFDELIKALNQSIPSFAKELGYERCDKLYNIQKGKYYPSFEILQDITKYFVDVNIDWLISGRGSMLRTVIDQPIPLEEVKPISPADEAFVYRMYKEEKEENKKLTAKMLKMAEEIGSLKRDIDFLVHQRGVDVPPALDVEDAV